MNADTPIWHPIANIGVIIMMCGVLMGSVAMIARPLLGDPSLADGATNLAIITATGGFLIAFYGWLL